MPVSQPGQGHTTMTILAKNEQHIIDKNLLDERLGLNANLTISRITLIALGNTVRTDFLSGLPSNFGRL